MISFSKNKPIRSQKYGLIQTIILDVSLNVLNSNCQPYNKPNPPISYINSHTDHPGQVLKQLPETINQKLIILTNNEESLKNIKKRLPKSINFSQLQL